MVSPKGKQHYQNIDCINIIGDKFRPTRADMHRVFYGKSFEIRAAFFWLIMTFYERMSTEASQVFYFHELKETEWSHGSLSTFR